MNSAAALGRNKMTNSTSKKTAAAVLSGSSKSSKLRTELRRVMSDRVLKITRCSQQQNVEKIKQRLTSGSENLLTLNSSTLLQQPQQSQHQTNGNNNYLNEANKIVPTNKVHSLIAVPLAATVTTTTTNVTTSLNSSIGYVSQPKEFLINKETSPKFLAKLTMSQTIISPNSKLNANKISLLPIKTFGINTIYN
jgi:hypothetical protein